MVRMTSQHLLVNGTAMMINVKMVDDTFPQRANGNIIEPLEPIEATMPTIPQFKKKMTHYVIGTREAAVGS